MNEERTRLWLRQPEHIHDHLRHRHFVTVNSRSDEFNVTTRNPWWFSSNLLLAEILYQWNPDRNHTMWNILLTGRYTPYACVAGMFLFINGKFFISKLNRVLNIHGQKIEKQNKSKKTKWPKQDSNYRLRLPIPEGGEPIGLNRIATIG